MSSCNTKQATEGNMIYLHLCFSKLLFICLNLQFGFPAPSMSSLGISRLLISLHQLGSRSPATITTMRYIQECMSRGSMLSILLCLRKWLWHRNLQVRHEWYSNHMDELYTQGEDFRCGRWGCIIKSCTVVSDKTSVACCLCLIYLSWWNTIFLL